MKIVIQRVKEAQVSVNQNIEGRIKEGLLLLVGIENDDNQEDAEWLAQKVVNMRIFDDEAGVMNRSVKDVKGNLLIISQFTLHASTKKGNRPSYIKAARPEKAIPLYQYFIDQTESLLGQRVEKGVFGADMKVSLINDGPVTIIIDSKNKV